MLTLDEKYKIAKTFGSASKSYDVSARLQRFSGKHLMPWLPNRNDLTVVDLGCGTGFFTDILASRYNTVIGLDISTQMLRYAQEKRSNDIHWVEGDISALPFESNSIDFIYCNLVIQWCDPLSKTLKEIMRVLKPGGLFAFCTLVDGTLFELKSSWANVDNDKHVIDFKSVEKLHAEFALLNTSLLEQQQKKIVLEYENVLHLAHELKGLGANRVPNKISKGLAGKEKWQQMFKAYETFKDEHGIYPATYQLFSGLAVKLHD
jgi:malonyl-CoA O-methyltransferase